MTITAESRIGHIAADHPLATRVFARRDIDFCCGGGKPLGEVCNSKGLAVDEVIAEIESEINRVPESPVSWNAAPLEDLIDHILTAYHEPLREELPRLQAMAEKVSTVHGDSDPKMFAELVTVFGDLKMELEAHMRKEEEILFPAIRAGHGASAGGPIAAMEHEHESAGAALRRLRELTNGYETPEWACNTYRALWHGLDALEHTMHEHIHLENNILFPRALTA